MSGMKDGQPLVIDLIPKHDICRGERISRRRATGIATYRNAHLRKYKRGTRFSQTQKPARHQAAEFLPEFGRQCCPAGIVLAIEHATVVRTTLY